jgi:hypothetical protein
MKKKMTSFEFSMLVGVAQRLSRVGENLRSDGSINWDFVSADLHIDNNIGEYCSDDVNEVLCAAEKSMANWWNW